MYDLAIGSNVFQYNIMDEAIQELDLLFNTQNTELLGDPLFGTDFEQFLWQMTPMEEAVENYIYEKLNYTCYCWMMNITVDVHALEGEEDSIYNVSITLSEPEEGGQTRTKVYQFS